MKNFKGIIMSEYTSQLTIMRHFPEIFSMIHMPLKPIALSAMAATLHYFYVRNSYFNSKYTPKQGRQSRGGWGGRNPP